MLLVSRLFPVSKGTWDRWLPLSKTFLLDCRLTQEQPQLIQEDHGAGNTQVFIRNDQDNEILTQRLRNAKWNMEVGRAVVVTVAWL